MTEVHLRLYVRSGSHCADFTELTDAQQIFVQRCAELYSKWGRKM